MPASPSSPQGQTVTAEDIAWLDGIRQAEVRPRVDRILAALRGSGQTSADTRRLDWLDKHLIEASDRTVRIEASEFDRTFRVYGTPQKILRNTLREAVDAAMSAPPAPSDTTEAR